VFSGIIAATGRVQSLQRRGAEAVLTVGGLRGETLEVGESIATNGVCLTVRTTERDGFVADLSAETLARTTLGELRPGTVVNLERSLRVGDRISGHFVFGHVDGVGHVADIQRSGDSHAFRFTVPPELAPFVVDKGSIAVDGISLTMCGCDAESFGVAVIPHTFAETNLRTLRAGDRVNLEVDMLARYVRQVVEASQIR
jgi:riboflavin synthase